MIYTTQQEFATASAWFRKRVHADVAEKFGEVILIKNITSNDVGLEAKVLIQRRPELCAFPDKPGMTTTAIWNKERQQLGFHWSYYDFDPTLEATNVDFR